MARKPIANLSGFSLYFFPHFFRLIRSDISTKLAPLCRFYEHLSISGMQTRFILEIGHNGTKTYWKLTFSLIFHNF